MAITSRTISLTTNGFSGSSARDITIDVRDLIREHIRSYPTGITLIKEFIQNADDARATELVVVLDRRVHPTGPLSDPRMKRLLGPSLLISNDELFTDDDHRGITTLLHSGKRKESGKTGRFGIGFNCCYNVTDFPSFISGGDIVCLDPCYGAVRNEGEPRSIRERISQLWDTDSAWLNTFTAMGVSPGTDSVPFTVFRLPLRREGFTPPDPITPKALSFDDFAGILAELKEHGTELLLFTKHVLKLKIGHIDEDQQNPVWDLVIETADPARVTKGRKPLIDALRGDPMEVLTNLSTQAKPPIVRYAHTFNISKGGSTTKESWMVLGGLFCGIDNRLIEHAKEMLRLNEKAIPLAGCAAKIVDSYGIETIAVVQGRLYCGLPIKRDTPLAFHVNGYFDTDSSRTDITSAEGVHGDDVKRAQWNLLLLEDAIGPCAAELVRTFVSLRPDTPAEALYKIFPPSSDTSDLFKPLAMSFYKSLVESPVIRATAGGGRIWEKIGTAWIVPTALQEPLIADGVVVAVPDVPAKVRTGFSKAGAKVNSLDPQALRQYLSFDSDVDCDIESAPKQSLRKREWVQEMLKFCYDPEKPESLNGLALAILADGRLHTFGKTDRKWVFVATLEQRDIFASQPHWFIDPKFCEQAELSPKARGPLRRMSIKDSIDALGLVLGERTNVQYIDRASAEKDFPTDQWLVKLFSYLAKVPRGELADIHSRTILRNLCVVPDQSGHLCRLGQHGTPLLRPAEKAKASLIAALSTLGVPFLIGPDTLIGAVSQFAAAHPDFVRQFSANRAALALKENGLAKTSFDASIHDPVIDFFANAFDGKDLTDQATNALASLPIIPTNGEVLVAADSPDVYLPPSFDLVVTFPATLVRRGLRDIRVPLLKKLGIQELTLSTVISKFIVRTYPALADDKRLSLLKWIRDVYYHLERQGDAASELRSVREELSKSEFTKCSAGNYRAAGRLYMPPAKVAIEILGEVAKTPCTKTYADFEGSWADFFQKCGVAVLPRPQDILCRVKELSSSKSGPDRQKALLKVVKCLAGELDHYSKIALPSGELLFQALKSIEWLPAFSDDKSTNNPVFTSPGRDLFRPKDIYPREMLALVGNVHPVLAEQVDPKLRDALGVPRAPAFDDVCKQMDKMSERIRRQGVAIKNIRAVSASFESIYQYFGRDAASPHPTSTNLAKRFEQTPCIFDKNGKLWLAKHVFANDYPCFGNHRLHFPTSDSTVAKGVDRLGRRPYPGLSDCLDFLEELASDCKNEEIPLAEASRLLDVYAAIASQLGERRLSSNTPLLTGSLRLCPAATLFREDTTRYRARIPASIRFVDSRVPFVVADAAGVPVLSRCIKETLVSTIPFTTKAVQQLEPLLARIRSHVFTSALQRLALKYLYRQIEPSVIGRLYKLTVKYCSEIKTKLVLHGAQGAVDAGAGSAESFYDPEANQLLLCLSMSDEWFGHFSKAILAVADPSQRIEVSSLLLLLTQQPSQYDSLLKLLDAPPLPEPDIIAPNEDEPISDHDRDDQDQVLETVNEKPDWDSMLQEPGDSDAAEELDVLGTPVVTGAQTRPTSTNSVSSTGVPAATAKPGPQPSQKPGGDSSADVPETISGAPIRLQDVHEPPAGQAGSTDQPHHSSRSDSGSLPRHGSNPFSARRSERVVTYVEPDLPFGSQEQDGTEGLDSERIAIGDAAERAVVKYELDHLRSATRMPSGNPGYDVYVSKGQTPEEDRYIEVKGTDGEWDRMGVGLTKPQFEMAKDSRQFWLYVVEWARTEKAAVYTIRDPYSRIGQFRFDNGWKSLAEIETSSGGSGPSQLAEVKLGARVQFTHMSESHVGTVRDVKGMLKLIVIEADTGEMIEKLPNSALTVLSEN